VTSTDPTFSERQAKAQASDLLWGAYHVGTGSDGVQQAEYFLRIVQPTDATLLVLDSEANPQGPSMTLEEVEFSVGTISRSETRTDIIGEKGTHDRPQHQRQQQERTLQ
jgi:lysozyme